MKTKLGSVALFVMMGLRVATPMGGQIAPPTMMPTEQPPKVGDVAPDFTLPSGANLRSMKLSDMRGKKKLLLAFYVFDFTQG